MLDTCARLRELTLAIDPGDIPYAPSFFTVGPLSLPVALGTVGP